MDLKRNFLVILLQFVFIFAQQSDANEAGKSSKLLTEKACKCC